MNQNSSQKTYDLEERTQVFARQCRKFVKNLKYTIANSNDGKQLIRSSGSVAANYIEANEAMSKKDFSYRIKICRKEAKESELWLKIIDTEDTGTLNNLRDTLLQEAQELRKIFGSIVIKCSKKEE